MKQTANAWPSMGYGYPHIWKPTPYHPPVILPTPHHLRFYCRAIIGRTDMATATIHYIDIIRTTAGIIAPVVDHIIDRIIDVLDQNDIDEIIK